MAKTKIWYTKNGRDHQIRQMETGHIQNCLRMILRSTHITTHKGHIVRWRGRYLRPLRTELERRGVSVMTEPMNCPKCDADISESYEPD